jgi:hypothetical protein
VVEKFPKRMEADKAGEKLRDLASRKNITLPSHTDKKNQFRDCWLSKLSGAEFEWEAPLPNGTRNGQNPSPCLAGSARTKSHRKWVRKNLGRRLAPLEIVDSSADR